MNVNAVLATPDRRRRQGSRDYAVLLFLYNTGARADETAHLTRGALDLGRPASVRILGKGRKTRLCPLWDHTAQVLRELLGDRLDGPAETPVFLNVRRQPLTRFGIHAVVERMVARAATRMPSLTTKRVSPHSVRHTTAVHLLRAGVDINGFPDYFGVELARAKLLGVVLLLAPVPARQGVGLRRLRDHPRLCAHRSPVGWRM